jgi:quinol monooxygenase YgiN
MIRLNVFIEAAEGKANELLAAAKELVAASVNDPGCVAYDVFTSGTRPGIMMICETWADAASLSAHEATKHFTTLVPRMQQLGSLKIESFNF